MENRLLEIMQRSKGRKMMESYPIQFIYENDKAIDAVSVLRTMTRLAQELNSFNKSNEIFKTLNKEDLSDIAMFLSENLYTIEQK